MLSNPFLFTVLRLLPASLASWLGGWLSAHVARKSMKLRDQRARANLAILRPGLDKTASEVLLTRRWFNLGRTMAELTNIDRLIENNHIAVEDAEGYQSVLDGPGPLIALAVHLGNWDLLAAHIKASTDRPGLGVYDPPENPEQAAQLKRARSSYMGEAITGEGAARAILKHLTTKDRATLYILLDERRDRQVWFPRFGRDLPPSGNLSVALRLARKVGAKFLPFYMIRTQGPNFRVHWHRPLDPAPLTDDQIMDQVDAFLGQACIDHADQWLALHDMDLTEP
ncbi:MULTISPECIES: lysophospholipid acyltransferase family protein [unclassified Sphingobium]|uniref:lysophospholipid acyltransferase family protein n=1 Tax=unclassified Sphingobium TaxID=2611147 RepID=UPI000770009A|nr:MULTISPECIES: lauroyl acyltransferase [unclassified Sphingobium]AMK23547.1 lipid A biosynthesis acyltransferase [Sphingobium sp. TKS]NML91383.1 lauroyl acyltransferase [Sphingobium sp. TB-6]